MHAFLIIGADWEGRMGEITKRITAWKISSWDTITLPDSPTIGIADIREFERYLRLTPQNSPAKAGVIPAIDRLTQEAQNALLKTLEEPPPHTYILAETATEEALLPTILSRFSRVQLGASSPTASDEKITPQFIEQLFSGSPGKRMQLVDPFIATREDAGALVTNLILTARQMMLGTSASGISSRKLASFIMSLLRAQSHLAVNVNQKLVIDAVVVHLV